MLWRRTKSRNVKVSSYVKLSVVVVKNSAKRVPFTIYCIEKVCVSCVCPPPLFFSPYACLSLSQQFPEA